MRLLSYGEGKETYKETNINNKPCSVSDKENRGRKPIVTRWSRGDIVKSTTFKLGQK